MFELNPEKIREDFPVLKNKGIYFDSACMSLKPKQVIDKINEYYAEYTACAGRSIHAWSQRVELEIAKAREQVRKFINAKEKETIITRNTTEGINLVANTLEFKQGDEVIVSDKEHNSNLLPWLKLRKKGIKVIVVPSRQDNTFDIEAYEKCFTDRTRLVSVVHTSNLDGVTNPVKEITKIAHKHNALCLVDGAQSVPHKEIDVKTLDIDFLSFSGHKMLGPTGTGILYGKKELLEKLDQFLVGGETVIDSTYDSYKPEEVPAKFEAGLQDYAGITGLGEACAYLKKIGLGRIENHETTLNRAITEALQTENKIRILGPAEAEKRGGIFSFVIEGIDIHHVSKMLDASRGIMTRSGTHCVHSWFNKHGMKGSVRASLYLYNTMQEVEAFVEEVKKIAKL